MFGGTFEIFGGFLASKAPPPICAYVYMKMHEPTSPGNNVLKPNFRNNC